MIDTVATVESNSEHVPGYRLLVLKFDESIQIEAGQFAMVRASAAFEPLLRRALAVYRSYGPRQLGFLYHVLGRGTVALSTQTRGSKVEALLPLGNSWPLPAPQESSLSPTAIVVSGGIGSASVLMLCEELARAGVDTQVFFGAASEREAVGCGLGDFRALGLPTTIATDDGSLGERGFVTLPLEKHLEERGSREATIYSCGPWPMMSRVAEIAARFGVRCLVSLEAPMGCGFGVCMGCVVAVKSDGSPGYDSYKRVCVDGTIFPAEWIRWEVNPIEPMNL